MYIMHIIKYEVHRYCVIISIFLIMLAKMDSKNSTVDLKNTDRLQQCAKLNQAIQKNGVKLTDRPTIE